MKILEKPYILIPLLLAVALGVFLNGMYGGKKEEGKSENKTEQASKSPEKEKSTATETAFDGEKVYKNTCIGCHGDQYQGVVGPTLKGLDKKYKAEDVEKILTNGRGGMPAGLVKGHEKEMAKWILTLK
jgi:cytochrome c550